MENTNTLLIDKNDYYKDARFASFSGLKVFSRCETLYRDLFVTREYEEPEQDYFIYGKLLDAMVTESQEFIDKNFIRVTQRVDPEEALAIENKIQKIQGEIDDPIFQEKLKKGNKITEKGHISRIKAIGELNEKLEAIKQYANKQQVVGSIWKNAEESANALRAHPYYAAMQFNGLTSQQIFTATIDGIPRKGKLDHLKLSPALTKIYAIWRADKMTLEEMHEAIRKLNPLDLWAIITDIKTCKDIAELEPYNNHYRGQLGYYQDLVSAVLLIPVDRIKLQILAVDKLSNKKKKAELFLYTQSAADELKPDILAWLHLWMVSQKTNTYHSAKEKHGMDQKCFTCMECSFCPLSKKPGEPVVVDGPRFLSKEQKKALAVSVDEISTADALLDY